MVKINATADDVHLELSWTEAIFASTYCCGVCSSLRVPYIGVKKIRIVENPWRELRGMRVGTGAPYVIMLGTRHFCTGKDFWAVYGTGPAVIMDLDRDFSPYDRWIFSAEPTDPTVVDLKSRIMVSRSTNDSLLGDPTRQCDEDGYPEDEFHE